MKNKIVSADEAAAIIRDRDTVCTSGFVGVGTPDELLIALEKRYRESRHPSALTLMFAAAPGDARDRGLNRLAHDGLLNGLSEAIGRWCQNWTNLRSQTGSKPTICRSVVSLSYIAALPRAAPEPSPE
jgi:acyl CoA:acetate/3-ketoacid CoA transferase